MTLRANSQLSCPGTLTKTIDTLIQCFMIIPQPMTLVQQPEPFDDWDWLYEIKHDGFRALAVIEHGQCRFFSRKKHRLTGYQDLRAALVKEVNAETAILDGELAVADHLGRSVFADMMQRRHLARYFAFDLLSLNGQDLRQLPLLTRKEKAETDLAVPVTPCPLCGPFPW